MESDFPQDSFTDILRLPVQRKSGRGNTASYLFIETWQVMTSVSSKKQYLFAITEFLHTAVAVSHLHSAEAKRRMMGS